MKFFVPNRKRRAMWKTTLLFSCYGFVLALACSCPEGSEERSREDAIRSGFYSSSDVYTAFVKEVNCRCYPGGTSTINCLREVNASGVIISDIPKRYKCDGDFTQYDQAQFQMCNVVGTTLVLSATTGSSNFMLGPLIDVTEEEQCGLVEGDGYDCELSTQPCFYNVTVVHVYKGDYQPGDVIGTTGPDVLSSCGTPNRLLPFLYQYVVGIGGPCDRIVEWTPLQFYDENEVALLVELEQQCAEDPSTCNGARASFLLATTALSSLLLFLVSLLLAL